MSRFLRALLAVAVVVGAVVLVACDGRTGPAHRGTDNSARLKGQVRCTGNTDPPTDITFQISKNGGPWLNNGQTLASQDCHSASNLECEDSREGADSWACSDPESAGTVYDSFTTLAAPLPPPIPCGPTSAPEPVTGLAYTLRYSDCFDTLDRTTWCAKQWWEPNAARRRPEHVRGGGLCTWSGAAPTGTRVRPCRPSRAGGRVPKSFRRGYIRGMAAAGPARRAAGARPSGSCRPRTRTNRVTGAPPGQPACAPSRAACRRRSTCSRGTEAT